MSVNHRTDHAWNAVCIRGNWFLLDNTWGAGHLDETTGTYKVEFKEFFFLKDPAEFVYSHFPYMNDDMEESMKWQLVENPWTLEKFNYVDHRIGRV